MAKKKAIKLAAATAVAASAFVAAAPAQTDAASNVATEVSKAVTQMKKAYHTYSDTVTATGEFADITAVYKEYNAAKAAYNSAKALVNKAGGSAKDAQLATLESTYDTYIKQRVVTYIDAYNYITKYVKDAETALQAGVDAKNLADVEEAYHAISYELKDRTAIIYRVYGETTRNLFKQYKDDAQDLRDAYQNDVTVAMKSREAEEAVKAGKLAEAAAAVEQINQFLPNVSETFKAELTTAAEKAVAAYEAAVTPAVESVSAVNGKEIEIKFNKAVNKDTVITKTTASGDIAGTLVDGVFNFVSLKKADGTTASNTVVANDATAKLSEDGKTLTVSAATGVFEGNYTVSVNKGVKTAAGEELPATSKLLYVKDTTAPTLVSGEASAKTSTNTITLSFSEPVTHVGAVAYINGAPATLSPGASDRELTVTSATAIPAGTTVNVSVLNVKDIAGNVTAVNPSNASVTVTANTTAPAVSSVSVTGEKTFQATFTKPVSQSSFANRVAVVTGGVSPSSTAFTVSNVSADGKTVTFTTSAAIFSSASTFSGTLVIDKEVLDTAGNKLGTDYTQALTFTKDVVAPAVTSVTTDDTRSKVLVTFGKNVTLVGNSAATLSGITLVNSNGAVVSLDASATASVVNNNQLQIDNNGVALAAGTYTVRLASELVTDGLTNNNKNAASTQTLVVTAAPTTADTTKPVVTISGTPSVTGYTDAVTAPTAVQSLSFTVQDAQSGIDINSILNLSNYTIAGKALPTGSWITTSGYNASTPTGAVTVTINMPSSAITESNTAAQLVVSNLKDLAGNVITPAISNAFAIAEGVAPELASAALATGDNSTLVVAFSEAVTGVDVTGAPSNFTLKLNNVDVTAAATLTEVTAGADKGKYYLQVAQSYDGASDTVFIDLNGNSTVDTGEVVLATGITVAPTATTVDFSSSVVTGLKLDLSTVTGIKDAQGNQAVAGSKVVK